MNKSTSQAPQASPLRRRRGLGLAPIPAAWRPPITLADLLASLTSAGLVPGDTILVHSSLSSLGHLEGGAPTVVEALLEAVSPGGTVLFPTFTGGPALSPQNPPIFRPHLDPCWTGAIPEAARQFPGAVRSLGPTHSVCALGARAAELTSGHEDCVTPCGLGSPFHKLREAGGKVLIIGVSLRCCTLFHHVEELAGAPYVCQPDTTTATVELPGGRLLHPVLRLHWYGPARDYPRFEPELIAAGLLTLSAAGPASLRVLLAHPFCELMILRVSRDPAILLADPAA